MIAYKRLVKFPRVILEGNMSITIRDWFDDNKLTLAVPPIYQTFVIAYTSRGCVSVPDRQAEVLERVGFIRVSGGKPEGVAILPIDVPRELCPHVWMELRVNEELLVEYNDEKTAYRATIYSNGKRGAEYDIDYNDIIDGKFNASVHISAGAAESPEEIEKSKAGARKDVIGMIHLVAAVQSYLMYHRPEEIEDTVPRKRVISSSPKQTKKAAKASDSVVIRPVRHKTIIIGGDAALPRREYSYKTMIWTVRGHYARRGSDKHLTYIAPFICRRGDTEDAATPKKYVIKALR